MDYRGENTPDYLVVQHMEPDHSANISAFLETFPDTVIVSSAPAFNIMKQFFGTDYFCHKILNLIEAHLTICYANYYIL